MTIATRRTFAPRDPATLTWRQRQALFEKHENLMLLFAITPSHSLRLPYWRRRLEAMERLKAALIGRPFDEVPPWP